jgi:hypothetical protein
MKYAAESPVSLLIRSLTIGLFEATPDKNTMSTLAADFMETCKKKGKYGSEIFTKVNIRLHHIVKKTNVYKSVH